MPTVKFYLNPYYQTDNYCPEAIQLAQGFKELGYSVIGNCNYWERDGECLIKEAEVDFDLAIFDHRYVYHTKPWVIQDVVDFDKLKNSPKVLLERQCGQELSPQWNRDGWLLFFDLICATDRTNNHPKNNKIIPWQIGVIQEVKDAIERFYEEPKQEILLYNFRVPHDVRSAAIEALQNVQNFDGFRLTQHIDEFPNDLVNSNEHELNRSTGGRYNPAYFRRINASTAFLTLGGYFSPKPIDYMHKDAYGKIHSPLGGRLQRKLNTMSESLFCEHKSPRNSAVLQWDSFRFWEGMYASCAPVALDFDCWNLALPETPTDGTHYLGLKDLNPEQVSKIFSQLEVSDVEWIGLQGKQWVDKHYSPRAQASRLLEELASRRTLIF